MKDLDYHPWDLLGSPRDPEGEPNVVGTHVCVAHPQGVSRSFPNEQIQDCSPRGGGGTWDDQVKYTWEPKMKTEVLL